MTKKDREGTEDLDALAREAEEWEDGEDERQAQATREDLQKLQEQIDLKSREAAEAQDKYLRTYADFQNYRKRMQRDLTDFRKYANEQLAAELLPVLDHLGLALKHASEAGETNQGLIDGVQMVYKQFHDALEKFGITRFKAEGEMFDPVRHDAVMQVKTADAAENTVVQVLQEGYLYHDKVLRHAKVGVATKPSAEEPEE